MVPAPTSPFSTAAQFQALPHLVQSDSAAGVTGSRMQSFTFSPQSFTSAEGPVLQLHDDHIIQLKARPPFPLCDLISPNGCLHVTPYTLTARSAALRGHGAKVTNGSIWTSELAKLCGNRAKLYSSSVFSGSQEVKPARPLCPGMRGCWGLSVFLTHKKLHFFRGEAQLPPCLPRVTSASRIWEHMNESWTEHPYVPHPNPPPEQREIRSWGSVRAAASHQPPGLDGAVQQTPSRPSLQPMHGHAIAPLLSGGCLDAVKSCF